LLQCSIIWLKRADRAIALQWNPVPRGVPHTWKHTSAETGRVLFRYIPAWAGGFSRSGWVGRPAEIRRRYGWEIVGPPPF
jgi:hypothetical protein